MSGGEVLSVLECGRVGSSEVLRLGQIEFIVKVSLSIPCGPSSALKVTNGASS